ncbi:MAG: hypothetical protein E7335_08060 [Clostridiales bacterium]|nr:hypothetical protein [Clostridiales bacterium]
MQLELLWNYMQVDMEAERFEAEMRNSPNRQQLIKQRDFLRDQQANMARIEEDVAGMLDRLEAVRDEAARLETLLAAEKEEIEKNPPKTMEEVEEKMASLQKLVDSLQHYEQELKKTQKDAQTRDRQQKEVRIRAARTKAEFDELKKQYDAEFKRDSEKLSALRAEAEKEAKKVDPALIARYRQIKQHVNPPIAKLVNNQCGGCFMSLPSAILKKLAAGDTTVECDNCGRILYLAEE